MEGISFDDASYTCVKLNNELYLYLKQVNKYLAFLCVIRDEVFTENRGIMDYNLTLFKDSVRDILLEHQPSQSTSQLSGQSSDYSKLSASDSMSASATSTTTLENASSNNFMLGGALLRTNR